jgi:hypothetical protein
LDPELRTAVLFPGDVAEPLLYELRAGVDTLEWELLDVVTILREPVL